MVVNNDAVSWRVLTRMDFDAIVLSPGPGHPSRWHDFGVCSDILRHSEVPVFGICLGHQGIGNLLEGTVNRAPMAMHGRLSRVNHEGKGLFKDVPQGFSVVRYHSLAITSPPGPEGHVVAWAEDGVVMGVEHTKRPIWGVQFHPESISTEYGLKIAENFFDLAASYQRPQRPAGRATIAPRSVKQERAAAAKAPGRAAAADADDRGRSADRVPLRTALRRAQPVLLARQRRRADLAGAVLLHGDHRRRRALLRHLRRRQRRGRGQPRRGRDRRAQVDLRLPAEGDGADRGRAARGGRARPGRRLRRLPRLRAEGRLRLAQRPQLRPARRGDDAGQPGRRRRPHQGADLRLRPLPRRGPGGRAVARRRRGPDRRGDRGAAAGAAPGAAERAGRPRRLPLRPRPRALPRRHRQVAGRTAGGRVLRGLPHRPVLDRRQPRAVRPLPAAAAQQRLALLGLPPARREHDRQLLAGALHLGRPPSAR